MKELIKVNTKMRMNKKSERIKTREQIKMSERTLKQTSEQIKSSELN